MMIPRMLDVFRPFVIMQVAAPKDPEVVEKYKTLSKKSKKLIDTFDIDHKEAFLTAANKHLRDKDKLIDMDLMDDESVREKFKDEMAKVYREKAAQILKSSVKPEDEFGNELLTNAVYGVTKAEIGANIAKYGKNYTSDIHEKESAQLMKRIKNTVQSIPFAHISDKHIDDIIKYTKADSAAASYGYELNKAALRPEAAAGLLDAYVEHGAIPKGVVEAGKYYFRKKKK